MNRQYKTLGLVALLLSFSLLFHCREEDEPVRENIEGITSVRLLFSPFDGGAPLIFAAEDPDGDGPEPIQPVNSINLNANTTYDLFLDFIAGTEELNTEQLVPEQHQVFFEFTDPVFLTPSGTGNISDPENQIIYKDFDDNQLPVGFITTWAVGEPEAGTFQILLKHFDEGMKSETSTAVDGLKDVQITWSINVE